MNLPHDAPIDAIQAYCESLQNNREKSKDDSLYKERKRQAEQNIIDYMRGHNIDYLQVDDRYLVLKDEQKFAAWNDELVLKCFIAFHQRDFDRGSIEDVGHKFITFCNQVRHDNGERKISLSISKKRPLKVVFSQLQSMGSM